MDDGDRALYPEKTSRSAAMPLLHCGRTLRIYSDGGMQWVVRNFGFATDQHPRAGYVVSDVSPESRGKTHIPRLPATHCAMAGSYRLMENLCATTGMIAGLMAMDCTSPFRSAPMVIQHRVCRLCGCLASCGPAPVLHDRRTGSAENVDIKSIVPRSLPICCKININIKHQSRLMPLEHRLVFKKHRRRDWTTDIDCYLRAEASVTKS